jgi:nucleotide-binding universal stress UspA family protein
MFRSLMVPLDGTPFGEHALPLAVSVARRLGAVVHLVHVHVPTLDPGDPALLSTARDQQERQVERTYLALAADGVRARAPDLSLSTELIEGAEAKSLAAALIRHVEKVGVDLLVMSSHGRRGLSGWWFGNVADGLVRRTSLPILLAHAPEDAAPRWERVPAFRHVLVPLDGSPLAKAILPTVVPLGKATGAEYSLLRVVEPVTLPVVDPTFVTAAPVETSVVDSQMNAARDYLAEVARQLQETSPGTVVHTQTVLDPQPAEAILAFTRAAGQGPGHPVDLIALATHGRGGLSRLLLGSVAASVLRQTTVPLLLQRPAGETIE